MKLYSLAVEYYSGMQDEKYIFFTERIQNTLLRPEILRLMSEKEPEEKQDVKLSKSHFEPKTKKSSEKSIENLKISDIDTQK